MSMFTFPRHASTVPYGTMAGMISQSNAKPTREEVEKVVRHGVNTEWKYEVVCGKLQASQKKLTMLQAQMSAPKTQPGMLALEKENEKNRKLQNELDELQVKYDNTVWRLMNAEPKIREMEKPNVEKVPEKAKAQELGMRVAPVGFASVKMLPSF